ncbi:MAG: hypothetical protein E6J90_13025 [Deltaproteobacteria bacterium]|nr:MAG: hypothetical protein E6J91_32750 [Deltaproteobacteria bacterium]TMQ22093.1 MAG: hypothetical protein E6J90_13025 [Deltaproteobacteria bacterium]
MAAAGAEAFARVRGAAFLRVGVRSRNEGARRLYAAVGFTEDRIELVKPLTGLDPSPAMTAAGATSQRDEMPPVSVRR